MGSEPDQNHSTRINMGENKTVVSIGNIQEDFIVLSIPVGSVLI